MTARQLIKNASFNLSELAVGGGLTSEQYDQFLLSLNGVIEGLTAEGIGGVTIAYVVALAGTTQVTTRTVTVLPTYAGLDVNNEYAAGFARVITWLLTVEIGGAIGKKQNDMTYAIAMAADAKRQIMPQVASPVAAGG